MSRAQPASDYIGQNTLLGNQIRSGTNSEAEVTVASATTTDIGSAGANRIAISGTTPITGLGTAANKVVLVRFTGALTLTYNATSLILPGSVSITTAAGDTGVFSSDSSGNWRCFSYTRGSGVPLSGSTAQLCKAWVNFNTVTTTTTTDSYNVISLTDNGTGDTTVNLSSAMSNANYCVIGSNQDPVNASGNSTVTIGTISSGSFRIKTQMGAVNGTEDSAIVCAAIFSN